MDRGKEWQEQVERLERLAAEIKAGKVRVDKMWREWQEEERARLEDEQEAWLEEGGQEGREDAERIVRLKARIARLEEELARREGDRRA